MMEDTPSEPFLGYPPIPSKSAAMRQGAMVAILQMSIEHLRDTRLALAKTIDLCNHPYVRVDLLKAALVLFRQEERLIATVNAKIGTDG